MKVTITIPEPRVWRWLVPIAAVAVPLAITSGGGVTAQEIIWGDQGQGEFSGSIDINIQVSGNEGCNTHELDDDKKCLLAPGETFTLKVWLDKNIGFTYNVLAINLTYTGGLTRVDLPDECAPGPFPFGFEEDDLADPIQKVYVLECGDLASPAITSIGALAEVEFACPAEKSTETITINYGGDTPTSTGNYIDTLLADFTSGDPPDIWTEFSPEGIIYSETIIINCDNYYPWDVHGPDRSAELDGIVDLPNDILGVILHFCPNALQPCSKANLP